MSPHISLTLSLILFCASIVVNIKTVILVLWIRKFIKNQIKLNKIEKHMDFQDEVLKKMDIKSNYILSLTHIEDNIYKLKTEDDKEYRCRKLTGSDSSCSHYIVDCFNQEDFERITEPKHISAGFKLIKKDDTTYEVPDRLLKALKKIDPDAKVENIPDGVRYSYKTGSSDKEIPPLKIPDDYVLASMEAKKIVKKIKAKKND